MVRIPKNLVNLQVHNTCYSLQVYPFVVGMLLYFIFEPQKCMIYSQSLKRILKAQKFRALYKHSEPTCGNK